MAKNQENLLKRIKANMAARSERANAFGKGNADWCNETNANVFRVLGEIPLGEYDCPACGIQFTENTLLSSHLKEICSEIGFSIETSYAEAFKNALEEGRVGLRQVFLHSTDFDNMIYKQKQPYGSKMVILRPGVTGEKALFI